MQKCHLKKVPKFKIYIFQMADPGDSNDIGSALKPPPPPKLPNSTPRALRGLAVPGKDREQGQAVGLDWHHYIAKNLDFRVGRAKAENLVLRRYRTDNEHSCPIRPHQRTAGVLGLPRWP